MLEYCNEPIFDLMEFLVQESHKRLHLLDTVFVRPLMSPCAWTLDMSRSFTKEQSHNDESCRAEFEEQVVKLESIVEDGYFELIVECQCYQECLSMLNEEYSEMGSKEEEEEDVDDGNRREV